MNDNNVDIFNHPLFEANSNDWTGNREYTLRCFSFRVHNGYIS